MSFYVQLYRIRDMEQLFSAECKSVAEGISLTQEAARRSSREELIGEGESLEVEFLRTHNGHVVGEFRFNDRDELYEA